jgi:hypothetical protein
MEDHHDSRDQIPPFAGGQGRTAHDIERDGAAIGIAFALAISVPLWALLAWALGYI